MLLVLSQAHLKKLFQGIHSVNFSDDQKSIIAMCSVAGEVGVDLPTSHPHMSCVLLWWDSGNLHVLACASELPVVLLLSRLCR